MSHSLGARGDEVNQSVQKKEPEVILRKKSETLFPIQADK